jgi:membrane protease YdiL (CAAX protease family)
VDLLAGLVVPPLGGVPVLGLVAGLVAGFLALLAYRGLVRWLEHRRAPEELARGDARNGLGRGLLLGLVMFAVTLAIIALFGGYRVVGWGSFWGALNAVGLMWSAAVCEELLFRGALFRILEEKTGTYGAIVVSGVVFGGLHILNPDATVWGALAIAVEAGLLFGAMYAATRSLWLPIGVHMAWNLAEGGIFGTAVSGSGQGPASLLNAVTSGPEILTGGQFGPEASIVAILVCGVPTVLFLRLAGKRGQILKRRA